MMSDPLWSVAELQQRKKKLSELLFIYLFIYLQERVHIH